MKESPAACPRKDTKLPELLACTSFSGDKKNRGLFPTIQAVAKPQK